MRARVEHQLRIHTMTMIRFNDFCVTAVQCAKKNTNKKEPFIHLNFFFHFNDLHKTHNHSYIFSQYYYYPCTSKSLRLSFSTVFYSQLH